jgi:hypothetical protein
MSTQQLWERKRILARSPIAVLVAVGVLLVAGCEDGADGPAVGSPITNGQSEAELADDGNGDTGADGGDGQGGGGGGGNTGGVGGGVSGGGGGSGGGSKEYEAPGAPIMVPARVQDQGLPISEVLKIMETGIREQCGGKLCVQLQVEQRDASEFCDNAFVYSDPGQRKYVKRGSTIVLVAGSKDCSPEAGGGEGESGGGEGGTGGEGETGGGEGGSSAGGSGGGDGESGGAGGSDDGEGEGESGSGEGDTGGESASGGGDLG